MQELVLEWPKTLIRLATTSPHTTHVLTTSNDGKSLRDSGPSLLGQSRPEGGSSQHQRDAHTEAAKDDVSFFNDQDFAPLEVARPYLGVDGMAAPAEKERVVLCQ